VAIDHLLDLEGAADESDVAVTSLDQVVDGQAPAPFVVDGDGARGRVGSARC